MPKKKNISADPTFGKPPAATPEPPAAPPPANSPGPSDPSPAAEVDGTWAHLHPERVWPD